MNRLIIIIPVLGFLFFGCKPAETAPIFQTGVNLQGQFVIPDPLEGQKPSHSTLDYLIYLPDGYGEDSEKLWPLIFFLHGAGDGDHDSAFVMSFGLPSVLFLNEQPDDFPFVVVSPQAFENTAWWQGDTVPVLNALVEEVLTTYQIDSSRIYLTGLSMGGYGSWFLATTYPDRFAAMVSVSGSGYRTPTLPDAEVLCTLKDIPVWVIHGALDKISEPIASQMYATALENCGGEVEWTLYPDEGHGGAYEKAYRDPSLYEWMLEHSR